MVYIYISLAPIKNLINHNLSHYSLHFYCYFHIHSLFLIHSQPPPLSHSHTPNHSLILPASCSPAKSYIPSSFLCQLIILSASLHSHSCIFTHSFSHAQITKGNDKFDETFPSLID